MAVIELSIKDHESLSKKEISDSIDAEIEEFSKYMGGLTDKMASGPLIPMERALIKTYLISKIKHLVK